MQLYHVILIIPPIQWRVLKKRVLKKKKGRKYVYMFFLFTCIPK